MAFWDYFFKKKSESATHAVDRIKFVLQSDRTGLPPETLERIKNDIISVLSKYVDIDTAELDFNITKAPSESGSMTPALCANIPIKGVKRNASAAESSKSDSTKGTLSSEKTEAKNDASATEIKVPGSADNAEVKTSDGAAKVSEGVAKTVDSTVKSIDGAAKTADSADSAAKPAGNAEKSVDGAAKTADNAVKSVDGVAKTADNTVKSVDGAAKTADNTVKTEVKTVKAVEKTAKDVDINPELGSSLDRPFKFRKD